MTYRDLYKYGVAKLDEAGIGEAQLDARLLLEYICHTDRNALLVHGDEERSELEEQFYRMVIEKRASRVPLQHITGEQDFMGLTFKVNEHTLIPRQDTETLVEEAMTALYDGIRILDVCTGSGCILVSLLHYCNEGEGVGVDLSEEALKVAISNAQRHKVNAEFIHSDLFNKVEGMFDMIVSNPPYIETEVIETLMPEVRDYEPRMALDGMADGLFFYRKIIKEAPKHLKAGGGLFFEIGYNQGEEVKELMEQEGFCEVTVVKDYTGLDRVVKGFKRN